MPSTRSTRLFMFAVLLSAYVVNSMNKMVFPVLIGDVRTDYGFSLQQSGLQSTIFALGVGLAGIPGGYLMSRLRRRTIVLLGTVVFSCATGLTAFAFGFWDMLLWQTVAGVGESLQLTALLAVAAAAFPRMPSTAIGSINVVFGVGAVAGPGLGGHLLAAYGSWRAPMLALAVLGLVSAVAVAALVRAWFTEAGAPAEAPDGHPAAHRELVNRNVLIMVVLCALGGLVTYGYIGMYPSFLRTHLGYTADDAGVVMGLSGVGALCSAFGGLLGDKLNPRLVLVVAYLFTAVAGVALFAGSPGYWWQLVWSLVMGLVFNAVVFVNLSSVLIRCVRPELGGAASGLFVASLFVPAAFAGYLFSWLVAVAGWNAAGLWQIAGGSLLAAAVATRLRPAELAGTGQGQREFGGATASL